MTKEEIKHVGKFFKKFLILLAVLFVLDRLIGTLLENAYQNAPQGDIKVFAHSITNPVEDIFIYGSSRPYMVTIPAYSQIVYPSPALTAAVKIQIFYIIRLF